MKSVRVFLSSTSEDMQSHRERVAFAIQQMGESTIRMETFGAQPGAPLAACRSEVSSADVVVVMLAWRYGWVPSKAEGGDDYKSITRIEVEIAQDMGLPVLAFLVDPKYGWTEPKEQDSLVRAKPEEAVLVKGRVDALDDFKKFLGSIATVKLFTTADDLAVQVTTSLSRWLQSRIPTGAVDIGQQRQLTSVHFANQTDVRFTVTNLSNTPQKVGLALDVMEMTSSGNERSRRPERFCATTI